MQQVTPKLGLNGLTSTSLVEKGRNHVNDCTANPNVTIPGTFLGDMTNALDALELANMKVLQNGGRLDHQLRNERRKDVEDYIRRLCGIVEDQCFGDLDKILSTGFEVRRSASPVGIVQAPKNLRARRGVLGGQVDLQWDSVRGRLMYEVWMNDGDPNIEAGWKLVVQTSKNRLVVEDLQTDKPYYFRVNAIGTAGVGPASDSAQSKAA